MILSIIIPIYNGEQYLLRCLKSISKSTLEDFECILIDDGSTDLSLQIAKDYTILDSRFKIFHQENRGVSAARNKGLTLAKGEYICFVDCDDWIEPELFSHLYNNAKQYNVNLSIGSFYIVDEKNKTEKTIYKKQGLLSKYNAIKYLNSELGFEGYPFAKMIKKDALINNELYFDESIKYCEDYLFFYKLISCCKNIYFDNQPLYNYFYNNDSVSKNPKYTKARESALLGEFQLLNNEKNIILKAHLRSKIASQALIFIGKSDFSDCPIKYKEVKKIFYWNSLFFFLDSWIHFGRKKSVIPILFPNLYKKLKK